jgi:hypothetical protein
LIKFKYRTGYGYVEFTEDGSIRYQIIGDEQLLRILQEDFSKGILILKDFKNKGIPGKMKTYKTIIDEEGLVFLLQSVQEIYPCFRIIIENHEQNKPIKPRYTLLKWNHEYSEEAKFIVQDNRTGMQSLFSPGKCNDLFWFHSDLA